MSDVSTTNRAEPERDEDVAWKFTAAYRLALMWQETGDYIRAAAAYGEALRLKPKHTPTLYNLGVTQIRLGVYDAAARTLDRLGAHLGVTEPKDLDPSRLEVYPLAYSQALVREYRQDSRAYDWSHALAVHLLQPHDEVMRRLRHPALLLHAGILLSPGKRERPERKRPERKLPEIDKLADAFLQEPTETAGETLTSGDLDDPSLILAYVRKHDAGDARSSYNLACYAGRLAEKVPARHEQRKQLIDRAVEYAELALQDPRLLPWAKQDPSLKVARDAPQWRKLVTTFEPE